MDYPQPFVGLRHNAAGWNSLVTNLTGIATATWNHEHTTWN